MREKPTNVGLQTDFRLTSSFSNVENVVNLDAGVKGGFTPSVF